MMNPLTTTTLELWPKQARNIINSKNISIDYLNKFSNIIFPWNDNYDQQRQLFSTQIQERPLFIIKAKNEKEIIEVLNLINKYKLSIRIVGGRHSSGLQNPDVFLVLSLFNNIKFDKYLHVGAGLTQGQVNDFLFKHSSNYYFVGAKPNHPTSTVFPGGSAASVGVAGISTVGGIGTLCRTLGLTIDSIKSFRIVVPPKSTVNIKTSANAKANANANTKADASAKVILASEKCNSDLFWALRGGCGANFGVITEIVYNVPKVKGTILYEISWDWKNAENVVKKWQKTAIGRPNTFNEDISLFCNHGVLGIHLTGIYVLSNNESYDNAIKTIKKEVYPMVKPLNGKLTIGPITSYSELYKQFVKNRVYHSFSNAHVIITNKSLEPTNVIKLLDEYKNTDKNNKAYVGLQLIGGEISNVNNNETAYYPRKCNFFIDIFNFWDSPVDQKYNVYWNDKTFDVLYSKTGPYVYLGFPHQNIPLHSYYGRNLERLTKIKHKIDPLGLLDYPNSLS